VLSVPVDANGWRVPEKPRGVGEPDTPFEGYFDIRKRPEHIENVGLVAKGNRPMRNGVAEQDPLGGNTIFFSERTPGSAASLPEARFHRTELRS
jgi:hypothetical protein